MRKIIVSEFMTLDGVMESPEKWEGAYHTDDVSKDVVAQINGLDAMLFGRVTYDIFAGYWPTEKNNESGFSAHLNSAPKYVVSTTLNKAEWDNTTVLKGDAVEEVTRLKQGPGGDIGITGSCTLTQTLMKAGLIDELQLLVYPIVLGSGMRLFKDGLDTARLTLAESKAYSSGVVRLIYRMADGG